MNEILSKRNLTIAAAVLCLFALICYFMPFIVVSASLFGVSQSQSFSGFEVFGELFSGDIFDGDGAVMSIWAIITFLGALAAIAMGLGLVPRKAGNQKIAGVCCVVSAVTLLLSRVAFNGAAKDSLGQLGGLGGIVDISMGGAGWWLAFIALIVAAIAYILAGKIADTPKNTIVY